MVLNDYCYFNNHTLDTTDKWLCNRSFEKPDKLPYTIHAQSTMWSWMVTVVSCSLEQRTAVTVLLNYPIIESTLYKCVSCKKYDVTEVIIVNTQQKLHLLDWQWCMQCEICFIHHKYLFVLSELCLEVLWWWKLLPLCFKLQPYREWSWYNGCSQLAVQLAVDISLNHGDTPCKTEFLLCAFLLLLATLHCKQKHYLCCSLNRNDSVLH